MKSSIQQLPSDRINKYETPTSTAADHCYRPINSTAFFTKYVSKFHHFYKVNRVKINHFTDFTDYVRPSEKSQRKELRKVLQHEFRGMLQKRMAVLLQVSKHKFTQSI